MSVDDANGGRTVDEGEAFRGMGKQKDDAPFCLSHDIEALGQ